MSGANPTIGGSLNNGNNIYNNPAYSMQNATASSPPTINAGYNYWGSAAGPYYSPGNTGGNPSSKVSSYVNYGNWSLPPSGSILISGGASTVNHTDVPLTLSCTDTSGCAQMMFSNDGSIYAPPQNYATAPTPSTWSLTSGEGTKTVYVKFKYGTGDWSQAWQSTIALDTTPPSPPTVTGASLNINLRPSWNWTTGGGGNGYRYQVNSESGAWTTTASLTYTANQDFPIGNYTLYVQESDAAGNWSSSGSYLTGVVAPNTLTTSLHGYGSVQGTSHVSGETYSCTVNPCPVGLFTPGNTVDLSATAATNFVFSGWSGDCTNSIDACELALTTGRSVTASFTTTQPALVFITGDTSSMSTQGSLIDAYGTTTDNSAVTILGQAVTFNGDLQLNKNIAVIFRGGYDPSFVTTTGRSVVHGKITISKGSLRVSNLTIR